MTRMTKCTAIVAMLPAVLAVLFGLGQGTTASGAVLLPVKFLAQGAGNNNCGPVSLVMAGCFVKGQDPTQAKVEEVNGALGLTDQADKSAEQLIAAGATVFGLTLQKHHWDLLDVKNQLQAVGPVIVAVKANLLPNRGYPYQGDHFVVAIGFEDDQIICNDPGTRNGEQKQYASSDFDQAMKSEGGIVVAGFQGTSNFKGIRILKNTAIAANGVGDVEVTYDDGRVVQVTHTGRCEDPALSPDGRTVAWFDVSQEEINRGLYYASDITLFRGNSVLHTLDPEGCGCCDLVFAKDGKHIAVATPGRIAKNFWLVDMDTANVVASCHAIGYLGATQVPDWARAISQRNGG